MDCNNKTISKKKKKSNKNKIKWNKVSSRSPNTLKYTDTETYLLVWLPINQSIWNFNTWNYIKNYIHTQSNVEISGERNQKSLAMTLWQVGKCLLSLNSKAPWKDGSEWMGNEWTSELRGIWRRDYLYLALVILSPHGTCHRWNRLATVRASYWGYWACWVDKVKLTWNFREVEVLSCLSLVTLDIPPHTSRALANV